MLLAKNNYEEPGPRGSAANFLAGVEMEGDRLGREEVEAGAHYVIINDSNKTVDDDKVDKVKLSKRCQKGGRFMEGVREEVVIESLATEAMALHTFHLLPLLGLNCS